MDGSREEKVREYEEELQELAGRAAEREELHECAAELK